MRAFFYILFVFLTFTSAAHGSTTKVRISTFNLKWFGLGGSMWNDPSTEFRKDFIAQFINEELSNSDIYVFTEVVNKDLLYTLIDKRLECVSYQGLWDRHQHVVLCYDKLKYRSEKYDEDYIIDTVNLGSAGLRPAVQSKICFKKGECFLQVIGVHLDAGLATDNRLRQVGFIKEALNKQSHMLPTVITGDFNSYSKEQSKKDKDDIHLFEDLLSQNSISFKTTSTSLPTYGTGEWNKVYDHIVISENIKARNISSYEACSKEPDLSRRFIPYSSFRKYFSDHCPISADLFIKH